MTEIIKWIDAAIAQLREQLRAFEELREKMIKSPEFDSADSAAADKLIKDSLPKAE